MNEGTTEQGRAVLRVSHDVDSAGQVIQVQIEPLADAPQIQLIEAAWQAARRCHPWIVGEAANKNADAVRKIAFSQVTHLMHAVDEALMLMHGMDHDTVHRLRDAVIDLRSYLPALKGEMPAKENSHLFRRKTG